MATRVSAKTFLEQSKGQTIVDVRSPEEFEKGHIPGAVNIPLFSNEERAKVGTLYKKKGQLEALLLGLDFVGAKMRFFAQEGLEKSKNNTLFVHCWRGGQRSNSMAWLFEKTGVQTYVLEGGYKAYRAYFKNQLTLAKNLVILSGNTGSGKTDVLKEMKNLGEQVIDLEGLAHHKGSAFGAIGQEAQLSTEQFENNLYEAIRDMDLSKRIWVEDESKSIGKNFIPDEFFRLMRSAPVVKINIPKQERIERLIKEYTHVSPDILIFHLNRIQKRLGPLETKQAIEAVQNGNMAEAVDISLSFYDKAYAYGLSKRDISKIHNLDLEKDSPKSNAKAVLEFVNCLKKQPVAY